MLPVELLHDLAVVLLQSVFADRLRQQFRVVGGRGRFRIA